MNELIYIYLKLKITLEKVDLNEYEVLVLKLL